MRKGLKIASVCLVVTTVGYLVAQPIIRKIESKHLKDKSVQKVKISSLKEKLDTLENNNSELEKKNESLGSNLKTKEAKLDELLRINKVLSSKLDQISETNKELLNENTSINAKLDTLTNMNSKLDNEWLKEEITYLKNNCTAKTAPNKKYTRKKKKVYKWRCRNEVAYNKCTKEKSNLWDNKCSGVKKYITVKKQVIHSSNEKKYDINENVAVEEKNYITEIIPEHTILNPDYPKMCSKTKYDLLSECNRKYCH